MSFSTQRIGRATALIVATGFLLRAAGDGTLAVTVVSPSGAAVAGATLTLTSPTQIGGARVAVTDAAGRARFPRLSPGQFRVAIAADGFQTQVLTRVEVAVDQTSAVNARLVAVGGATVEVVAVGAARVDVTTVTQGTQIDTVQLESLPVGRTQLQALSLAPGVLTLGGNPNQGNNPGLAVGLNRDNLGGNGARNNTYLIDGMDVTSPEAGVGRTNLAPELIQVQDVKTGAITAEYTARAGLFSNATTKVGGNEFSGGLTYLTQPTAFVGSTQAGNTDAGKKQVSDLTLWSLGPILKDKLWYVLSYQKRAEDTTVAMANSATLTPGEQRKGINYDGYSLFAKLTWQASKADTFDFTFNNNPYEYNNLSDPAILTRRGLKTTQGGSRWLAHWAHQWDNVFLDLRVDRHKEENTNAPLSSADGPQNTIKASVPLPPLQAQLGNNGTLDARLYQKDRVRGDLTWLLQAAGSHTLKAGFEIGSDQLTQTIGVGQGVSYESFLLGTNTWGSATLPASQAKSFKPRVLNTINNSATLRSAFTTAGYTPTGAGGLFVSSDLNSYMWNQANPAGGFYEYRLNQVAVASSTPKMLVSGFYVQDQWQIGRFSFNPGVRLDKYTYKADNGQELFATGYNAAPRVGLTYDVLGDGKAKLYAYWGRYIDPIKLDMVRFTGSLTSSVRTEDIYMLGQWVLGNTRGGTKTVDAVFADSFKLPKTDEFRLGYSMEFKGIYTFDVTWTHRRDYDIVEDWDPTLYTDPNSLEQEARGLYSMGSTPYGSLSAAQKHVVDAFRGLALPFSAFAGGGFTGQQNVARVAASQLNFVLANLPGGERVYNSWDFTLTRREANHWGGFASFTKVDAKGNSFSSGNADYQGDLAQYDPRLPYTNGHLDGSVDWLFKSYAYYRFDLGLLVGATLNAHSGFHYSTSDLVGTRILESAPALAEFDSARLGSKMSPRFYQLDLRVQYGRNLTKQVRGEVFLDIFNFTDRQRPTVLSEGTNVRNGAIASVADQPYQYQLPRTFQLGVRLKF